MKPNFALNLSLDGISLLHRAKAGWMPVGEVQLDDPDLNAQLGILRQTAADLDQSGLACKLVIPNSQILYTELTAEGPDEPARIDQIRKGLVGLTPYDVDDLVFDWRANGSKVQVAVVAQDTLKEAEAFAAEFRFNPVSFIGVTSADTFQGEPFFGPCAGAAAILGQDVTVEPDTEAMKIVAARKAAVSGMDAPARAKPKVESKPKKPKRQKKAEPEGSTTAASIPEASAPIQTPVEAPAETPDSDTSDKAAAAIAFSSRRAAANPSPAIETPLPPPTIEIEPRAQISRYSALDLDDVPDMPAWRNTNADAPEPLPITAPQIAGMEDAPAPASRLAKFKNAASSVPRNGNRKAAIAASSKEAKAMTVFGAREKTVVRGKPKYLGLALTLLLLLALGVAALWSSLFLGDRDVATAPGQIAGATQGIPAISTPETTTTGTELEAAPTLVTTAPEVTEPTTPSNTVAVGGAETSLSTAIESAVTSALSEAPVLETGLPNTESAAPLATPTQEPATEEPAIETALLQDPVNSSVTASPPPDRITQAPPTQAEAERRYATSGIWQLDPNPLADPASTDRLENLLFASIDPNLIEQTPGRFTGSNPDVRPPSLTPPAPLGATFNLNNKGLIVATPEGALSPDGVVVYLGLPPQVPGVRPGTPAPAPSLIAPEPELSETASLSVAPEISIEPNPESTTSEPTAETTAEPAVEPSAEPGTEPTTETASEDVTEPASETVPPLTPEQEILRQIRPIARPASFDETFDQAPNGEGFTLEQLASIRPTIRPPSIQEEVAADEPDLPESETDAENDETDAEADAEFALASSTIPRGRPAAVERAAAVFLEKRRETAESNPSPKPEVEVAAVVVPNVPARASVARAATERNAINLSKVNLIGVYGSSSDRRALVRLKSGRYVKVEVGDRVDGGRVAAISDTELRYVKSGRNITLKLPKG